VTEQLASAKRNFEVGTQTITDTHEAQAATTWWWRRSSPPNDLDNKRSALQRSSAPRRARWRRCSPA
jgi:outer membrane protein